MFSPHYARARRRGPADPLDHCAFNVALHGRRGNRWAFTERGRGAVQRCREGLAIGASSLAWEGEALCMRLDEVTAPLPSRIRGIVRVRPEASAQRGFALDANARHWWTPIAPRARIEVALDRPALRWSGTAYLDANAGSEPLADAFSGWTWSRAHVGRDTAVVYDVVRRGAPGLALALLFGPDGSVAPFEPPPLVDLPRTRWRMPRPVRAEPGSTPRVARTLQDTPFYARSLVDTHWLGVPVSSVHESLSLDRFRARWVQALLPFRSPRAPM